MATSGFRPYKEDENVKGPLEYVSETEECICGWCGQVLIPHHTNETPDAHFKRCKNFKNNGLLKVFKELRLVQKSLRVLNEKIDTVKAEMMEQNKADYVNMKTELKMELETLKKGRESSDGALVPFNNKIKVLEDGMKENLREMRATQEKQMTEVNGRFTGVTETIVHSMLEGVRGKLSADTNELDQLKRKTETLSEQLKTNVQDYHVLKKKLEIEGATDEPSAKKKRLHVEPSPSEQLTILMNSFNLVTSSHLFRPSYKWTIEGIKNIIERRTVELGSEMFQWNGYPVQARAKLQLKENDCIHISLHLNNVRNDESSRPKNFMPIPTVFYLLKDNSGNAKHACRSSNYLTGTTVSYFLAFNQFLVPKSWLNRSAYNVADSIEIEIYVQPSIMAQLVHSYDGTLEWNMENYARRLQLEKDGLVPYQESPYFYTGPKGYRVRLAVFLKGNEGKGVTARILFVTGKFDADLPKFFPHSTTVTLFNRKEPETNVTKTVEEDNKMKRYYDLEICKLEEVENFVENGTLLFKVSIKAL